MFKNTSKTVPIAGLIVWICCLIFYLYEFFLRTFVGTVAESIIHDLSLSAEQFALMGSAYYFTYSLMQIPVGYITDRFGAKKVVILATLLCALSLFLFSNSNHFLLAFLSRFLMGLGSSFGFVTLLVVITNWFPARLYPVFIGLSQFIGTLGPLLAAGPLITLLKSLNLGWRATFIYISLFGVLFGFLMFFLFKNKPRDISKDSLVIERPKSLLFQMSTLFKNKQAWLIAFFSALSYESVDFLGAVWGTFYLQSRGLSYSLSGYTISIAWLGFATGCPLTTLLSQKLKRRKPILIILSLIGFASTFLMIFVQLNPIWLYQITFFFIGIAASALNLGITIIVEHVEISVKALALGFNNGLIILFGAIVPILTSFLIHLPKDTQPAPENFQKGFLVMPAMFLIAFFIACFFIRETFCRPQKQTIVLDPKEN